MSSLQIEKLKQTFDTIHEEIEKSIIGQRTVVEHVLVCMLCGSNGLLESYPGLGKTSLIKAIAEVMELDFRRVQCTPDLMPSDIVGTEIIDESTGKRLFKFQKGPVFTNILLADEINRATPKTQSALLEAMQEKQVTVSGTTYKLDAPFFVLATQNPIEQEGSLALTETVFVNGQLKTGKELLDIVYDNCIAEDEKGIKLYDLYGWTFSLNSDGKLEKQKCLLYTLPYHNEMIKITTKTGKKITVTKNHPFLVNENGIICWKKAEELTKQDYLVNPAKLPAFDIQKIMSHEETVSLMTQKPLLKEIHFDKDFAFWIAFLLSDGTIGEKCVEAVQKNYPEALDNFVEISKRYGFNPVVFTNRGCRYARIYSKPLVEYLRIRFNIKGGADKEIPTWFLGWPSEMNREFLKVFISMESSLRDNRIVFTQKSARNINLISYMLLREGIISWMRHDGRIFRMKIQGKDFISFIKQIGWVSQEKIKGVDISRTIKSSFRVVPVDRKAILRIVDLLGINSFHTLKGRKNITSRSWYGSYKGIKQGEVLMSIDSLKHFVADIRREVQYRQSQEFSELLEKEPRQFAAGIGLPMTEIARQLKISKNQVWKVYTSKNVNSATQIQEFLTGQQTACVEEVEILLRYCEALLSEDVYYDGIKSIDYTPSEGMAFGLTVPELQNYIGGFGGGGIHHNTYPLPEAQTDRFLLKILVGYPDIDEEFKIVTQYSRNEQEGLRRILGKNSLLALQRFTRQVPIANDLMKYVINLVTLTRTEKEFIEFGASPRASIGLVLAAKARALMHGRAHVSEEDIREMVYPILRHRLILNFEAERKGLTTDKVIDILLKKVKA